MVKTKMSGMNFKKTLLALLLTLTLLFALMIPTFASEVSGDETTDTALDLSESTVAEPGDETTSGMQDAVVSTADGDDTTVAEPDDSDSDTEAVAGGDETTTASGDSTTDGATTTKGSTTATTTTAADEGFGVGDWISVGIGAAILLVIIVLAILFITAKDDPEVGKNGEKVPFSLRGKRFFRSCKSEAKKVVWTPWKTVRKNTIVVLIVIIICSIVIGLLDWIFSGGFNALAGLF